MHLTILHSRSHLHHVHCLAGQAGRPRQSCGWDCGCCWRKYVVHEGASSLKARWLLSQHRCMPTPTSIRHVQQAFKAIATQHGGSPAAAAAGAGSLANPGSAAITKDPARSASPSTPVAQASHAGACWAGVEWSQQLAARQHGSTCAGTSVPLLQHSVVCHCRTLPVCVSHPLAPAIPAQPSLISVLCILSLSWLSAQDWIPNPPAPYWDP
jgi:hypothetical protein